MDTPEVKPQTTKALRAIADWMAVLPDQKVLGGMILSWGEASKELVAAAEEIDRLRALLRLIDAEQNEPFPTTLDGPMRRDGRIKAIVHQALKD